MVWYGSRFYYIIDYIRPFWLPGDWACGVKTTCRTYLPCFIGPDRKMFYHKVDIEKYLGVQLGPDATKELLLLCLLLLVLLSLY